MRSFVAFAGLALLVVVAGSTARAMPADLTDTTDRMLAIEIVDNADVGVYASDLDATFASLGDVPVTFSGDIATITVPADVWEQSLEATFGSSSNGTTDPGIVAGTTSDYVMTIDTVTGDLGPVLSWTASLIIDLAGSPLVVMLDYRPTDTARAVTEWMAPAGTDYFFLDADNLPISCDEWVSAAPAPGECDAADFRGDDPYDPGLGTFTFLGVASNQFVPIGLASPNYALTRFQIMEVPEPSVAALQLAAFGTLSLLARRRARQGRGTRAGRSVQPFDF